MLRFHYHPEYLRIGETLLFREGRAKGVGRIRALTGAHGSGSCAGDPVGALPVRPPPRVSLTPADATDSGTPTALVGVVAGSTVAAPASGSTASAGVPVTAP